MVPIAKAALVTLLIGCGATGTFALANGGFGIGTATENSNEQGSDVPPASPEVANTAGGNTQEAVSVPEAGTVENQVQVNQEGSPDPNVRDADTSEGRTETEETVNQPQDQGDTPPSVGAGDGLQETQSLGGTPEVADASGPSAQGNPDTNKGASISDGHQDTEIAAGGGVEDTVVQQQVNEGQETTGGKQSQGPTQESVVQTSSEGPKVVNTESDSSLQNSDATPTAQSSQAPGKEPNQNATNPTEQGQISSGTEGIAEHTDALDSGRSSDQQNGTKSSKPGSDSNTASSLNVQG